MQDIENEEDARVSRAANDAARDTEDEDEIEATHATGDTLPRGTLNPTGPDLEIVILPDQIKGRYAYRMRDAATGLSHNCVRILPGANETGLALMAVTNGLKSITRKQVNGLILTRYGFASRTDAIASGQRLRVQILVTNPDLAQLGQIVTAPENRDAFGSLPLGTANDRHLWAAVNAQVRRFDLSWAHIATRDWAVESLDQWADAVQSQTPHWSEPQFSQPTVEVILPPLLVRLTGDNRVLQLPPDVAQLLVMRRLATVVGDATVVPDVILDEHEAQDFLGAP